MEKVNVDQFICSLIRNPKMPDEQTQALVEALHEQGLWYNIYTKDIDKMSIDYKYNVGQWLIFDNGEAMGKPTRIKDITSTDYIFEGQTEDNGGQYKEIAIDDIDNNPYMRLWTIKDAEIDDILIDDNCDCVFVFRHFNGEFIESGADWWKGEDKVDTVICPVYSRLDESEDIRPATIEERQEFLDRLSRMGYEYDITTHRAVSKPAVCALT